MVKYRYLLLFVFAYAIGAENSFKDVDIFNITQQHPTLRTMPTHVFDNVLEIFKERGGYKESELAYDVAKGSVNFISSSRKKLIINKKEGLLNIKSNKNKKKIKTQGKSDKKSNTKSYNNSKSISDNQLLDQCIRENQEISKEQVTADFLESEKDSVLESETKSEKNILEKRLNYINSSYDFYKENIEDPVFIPKKEFYLKTLLKISNNFKTTKAVTKKDNTKKKELFALHHKIEEELLDLSKNISLQSVISEVIEEISSKNNGSVILLTNMNLRDF